jgi:hypothetical protein
VSSSFADLQFFSLFASVSLFVYLAGSSPSALHQTRIDPKRVVRAGRASDW